MPKITRAGHNILIFQKAAFRCHPADAISGCQYYRNAAAVSASDPTRGAYNAPPDTLAGFERAVSW